MKEFILTYNQKRSLTTGEIIKAASMEEAITKALLMNDNHVEFDGVVETDGLVNTVYSFTNGYV